VVVVVVVAAVVCWFGWALTATPGCCVALEGWNRNEGGDRHFLDRCNAYRTGVWSSASKVEIKGCFCFMV